jgi:putative ABC transport system permease protein
MLVLNSEDELSDLLLARYGFFRQDQFLEIINKATGDGKYDESLFKEYFGYDELLGKTLTWYPNDTAFGLEETKNPMTGETVINPATGEAITSYVHYPYSEDFEGGIELTVVGILAPKDNINFGTVQSGIFYTEEFADIVLNENADSEIFEYINNIDESDTTTAAMQSYYISYSYTYSYGDNEDKPGYGAIGPAISMEDMMMGGSGQGVAGLRVIE